MTVRERHWYGIASLTTKTYRQSAASEVLEAHGVTTPHRWAFFASKRGRSLDLDMLAHPATFPLFCPTANTSPTCSTISTATAAATADLWRRRLLDLSTAKKPTHLVLHHPLYPGRLVQPNSTLKKDFDAWWTNAGPEIRRNASSPPQNNLSPSPLPVLNQPLHMLIRQRQRPRRNSVPSCTPVPPSASSLSTPAPPLRRPPQH